MLWHHIFKGIRFQCLHTRAKSEQERFADDTTKKVLIISVGAMSARSLGAAEILEEQGMAVTVVDPRWLCPVAPSLVEMAD